MVIFVGPFCCTFVNGFLGTLPLEVVGLPLGVRVVEDGVVLMILLGTMLELARDIAGLLALSPAKCLVGRRTGLLDDEASSGLDGTLVAVVLVLGLAVILVGMVAMATAVDLPGPVLAELGP